MEPLSIALICAAGFGAVILLTALIRQILFSRDKKLNDQAQSKALAQEVSELERMRLQMQTNKRFDSHYQILGANKDEIKYIDTNVERILRKKAALVEHFARVSVREAKAIASDDVSSNRKLACDRLRDEVEREITFYDSELKQLQERRAKLWDVQTDFQKHLLGQEKSRNLNMDHLYTQHSALLEKIYLRHIDDTENVAVKGMDAATLSFKDMIMLPIQFLLRYFGIFPTTGISLVQTRIERAARTEVMQVEQDINTPKKQVEKVKSPKSAKSKSSTEHAAEDRKEAQHKEDDLEQVSTCSF